MYIQFYNFMIALTDNGKNILFLILILYSVFMTTLYFKSKLEATAMKTYYEDQIIPLKEKYKSDKQKTKIQLYEEYLIEKQKLLEEYKESPYTSRTKYPEDYYVDVSKYENNLEYNNSKQERYYRWNTDL